MVYTSENKPESPPGPGSSFNGMRVETERSKYEGAYEPLRGCANRLFPFMSKGTTDSKTKAQLYFSGRKQHSRGGKEPIKKTQIRAITDASFIEEDVLFGIGLHAVFCVQGRFLFSKAIRTRKTNLLRQPAPPEDLGMPYDPYKAELFQGGYVGVIDNGNSAELFGTYTCMNAVCERLTIDEFHLHLFNDNKRVITLLQNPEWILELMNRNKTQGGSEDSWNRIVVDFHLLLYIKALKVSYTAEWFERNRNGTFYLSCLKRNQRVITLLQNPEWILELMNRNKTQGGSEDSWNRIVVDFHLLLYIKALKVSYTAEWFERNRNGTFYLSCLKRNQRFFIVNMNL